MFKLLIWSLLLLVLAFGALSAQNFEQDASKKVPLIIKALNYNKTLKTKIKDDCVIAVLFNPQSEASVIEKDALLKLLKKNKKSKVYGKNLQIKEIAISETTNLDKRIIIYKINVFWLTSDLAPMMNRIRESAKFNQVLTVSTQPEMVNQSNVALASQKTDNGYKLVVNLNEAKNINIDFSANLLTTAIVIR